jgi:hypothetical protein
MWTDFATDMAALATIFVAAKVRVFRFLACPAQKRSWLHTRQLSPELRAQPNRKTVPPEGRLIILRSNISPVRIFCDCEHKRGTFIVSLSSGFWQTMATALCEK